MKTWITDWYFTAEFETKKNYNVINHHCFRYEVRQFPHHRAGLAFRLTQQSVNVDGLAVFCGEEFSESLQSPHSVSCS